MVNAKTVLILLVIVILAGVSSYWIVSLGQYEEINLGITFKLKDNLELSQVAVKFEEERTIIELNISHSNEDLIKEDAVCIYLNRKNSSLFTFNGLKRVLISNSGEPFKDHEYKDGSIKKDGDFTCYYLKNIPQELIGSNCDFFMKFEFNSIFSRWSNILENNKIVNLLVDGRPMMTYFIGIPINTTLVTNYPSSIPANLLHTLAQEEGKMKFYIFDKSDYNSQGNAFTANVIISVFDTKLFIALIGLFLSLIGLTISIMKFGSNQRQHQNNQSDYRNVESQDQCWGE